MKRPYIISVTGTKGKTSTVRLLSYILGKSKSILRVDSDGVHFLGETKETIQDSVDLYGFLPSVAPGRFLYHAADKKNVLAIMEASIGCGVRFGLGYKHHNIGIFTNVFDDHIDSMVNRGIKSRTKIAQVKASFIFRSIAQDGYAVFNADDPLVCKNLDKIPENKNITLIPVGFHGMAFKNLSEHLNNGGVFITSENDQIGIRTKNDFIPLLDIKDLPQSFNGIFTPFLWSVMFCIGALYAYSPENKIPSSLLRRFSRYTFDVSGKRAIVLKNKKKKYSVVIDYAHEKYSLQEIAKLAHGLGDGRSVGVFRPFFRADKDIKKLSKILVQNFDDLIFFESDYQHLKTIGTKFYTCVQGLLKKDQTVVLCNNEEQAVKKASEILQEGDVLVYLPKKDYVDYLTYVKKYLGIEVKK